MAAVINIALIGRFPRCIRGYGLLNGDRFPSVDHHASAEGYKRVINGIGDDSDGRCLAAATAAGPDPHHAVTADADADENFTVLGHVR
jgi:hypothetical protein